MNRDISGSLPGNNSSHSGLHSLIAHDFLSNFLTRTTSFCADILWKSLSGISGWWVFCVDYNTFHASGNYERHNSNHSRDCSPETITFRGISVYLFVSYSFLWKAVSSHVNKQTQKRRRPREHIMINKHKTLSVPLSLTHTDTHTHTFHTSNPRARKSMRRYTKTFLSPPSWPPASSSPPPTPPPTQPPRPSPVYPNTPTPNSRVTVKQLLFVSNVCTQFNAAKHPPS